MGPTCVTPSFMEERTRNQKDVGDHDRMQYVSVGRRGRGPHLSLICITWDGQGDHRREGSRLWCVARVISVCPEPSLLGCSSHHVTHLGLGARKESLSIANVYGSVVVVVV